MTSDSQRPPLRRTKLPPPRRLLHMTGRGRLLGVLLVAVVFGGIGIVLGGLGPAPAPTVEHELCEESPVPEVPSKVSVRPLLDVPLLTERPRLDSAIREQEWRDARRISGEFIISDGSLADGAYPFTLWIGHDATALHLAIRIEDIGPNPFTDEEGAIYPDRIGLFFADDSGELSPPSDDLSSNLHPHGNDLNEGYWTGLCWANQQDISGRGDFNDGLPPDGRWAYGNYTENAREWEIFIPRTSELKEYDGLDLDASPEFRMLLRLVRQDQISEGPKDQHPDPDRHHDYWPGEGFNGPGSALDRDASGWLRLRLAD